VTRAQDLSLTVTVIGAVPRGQAITRAGARPGDTVYLSGEVGDAALAIGARRPPRAFVQRQRRPVPRIALGIALRGIVSAGLDVSDGVVQDLGHVCDASGVGAVVRAGQLPLSPAYRRFTAGRPDALDAALAGGEDYELLVTVPRRRAARAEAAARTLGIRLTAVGEIVAGAGVRVLDAEGRPYRLARGGHDHLRPTPRTRGVSHAPWT